MFELKAAKLMLKAIGSPAWGFGGTASTPNTAQSVCCITVKVAGGNVGVEPVVVGKTIVKVGWNVNMCVDEVTVANVNVRLGWKVRLVR